MREIAGFLGETEDEAMFETTQEAMLQNIEGAQSNVLARS
jgi:hypothetical protein